jgi:hypothetical protein
VAAYPSVGVDNREKEPTGLAAAARTHFDTALRLTAIALLLRPMGPWFVQPVLLALGALVLVAPRALQSPITWFAVTAAIAVRIIEDLPLADNHIYLLTYCSLAIALSLRAVDAPRFLSFTSRWLIGLAFSGLRSSGRLSWRRTSSTSVFSA